MFRGDSLPEKLFSLAKKSLFVNHQERELVKSAAIRIQTLQAERHLMREPLRWLKISPAGIYECSGCGQTVMTDDIDAYRYCPGCGRAVKRDAKD